MERTSMNSGRTSLSKVSPSRKPSSSVASRNVLPSRCAFLAHFATSAPQFTTAVSRLVGAEASYGCAPS